MKKFTFFLAAALFCGSLSTFAQDDEVKVTPAIGDDDYPTFKFNKDYMYYGIYLGEDTRSENGVTDDQYVYLGPDDKAGRVLQVWASTCSFDEPSGMNSLNVLGEYMSLKVGDIGWSGIGYNVDNTNSFDLSGINDDYTFHIALKAEDDESVDFYLTNGSNREAHLVFGDKAYGDKEPIANFDRDGEWYNIDIPMTYLEDQFGFSFKKDKDYKDKNLLCVLAGGKKGFVINYDAVFFYGPKNSTSGVKEINAAEKNAPVSVYTADGKKVSQQYAKANKGIYIVKQGDLTKKVVF